MQIKCLPMKTAFTLFSFWLLLFGSLTAQNSIEPNAFVKEAYTAQAIAAMSSEQIEYLNYLSISGWEIMDIAQEKQSNAQSYPHLYKIDHETKLTTSEYLTCTDLQNFNLLTYQYVIKKQRNYYQIEGCSKVLVIRSHSEITKGFNEFRNL